MNTKSKECTLHPQSGLSFKFKKKNLEIFLEIFFEKLKEFWSLMTFTNVKDIIEAVEAVIFGEAEEVLSRHEESLNLKGGVLTLYNDSLQNVSHQLWPLK